MIANWYELRKMYESLEACDAAIMNVLRLLSTIKPGFMVTAVNLSQELISWLPKQITPYFYLCEHYLTLGEENVKISHDLYDLMGKLKEADLILKNIAPLYETGLKSILNQLQESQNTELFYNKTEQLLAPYLSASAIKENLKFLIELKKTAQQSGQQLKWELQDPNTTLGPLMVWQRITKIQHDDDTIDLGNGSSVLIKDYFKDLQCLSNDSLVVEKLQDKFNDLVRYLMLPLEEIIEERVFYSELFEQIKSLIIDGLGSRNKDFWESDEYSFLKYPYSPYY